MTPLHPMWHHSPKTTCFMGQQKWHRTNSHKTTPFYGSIKNDSLPSVVVNPRTLSHLSLWKSSLIVAVSRLPSLALLNPPVQCFCRISLTFAIKLRLSLSSPPAMAPSLDWGDSRPLSNFRRWTSSSGCGPRCEVSSLPLISSVSPCFVAERVKVDESRLKVHRLYPSSMTTNSLISSYQFGDWWWLGFLLIKANSSNFSFASYE